MPERVNITKPCFAERLLRLLEQHNAQRMAEQDARRRELQLWANVFEVVYRTTEQALKSNLEAEPPRKNRRCDILVMGDDERAANLRGGDHREHGDREAMGSEGSCSMREAGSPGLRAPPGLEASEPHRDASPGRRCSSNWIPSDSWKNMCHAAQEVVRLDGRNRRQKRRRQRIIEQRRGATAEHDATDTMRAHGAHPDFRWQYQCRQPWQQYWQREQRLPQALQRPNGGSSDHMWMTLHQPHF